MFTQCGPDCIAMNGCKGNCCDAPSRPTGTMITVHPSEQAHIERLGGVVVGGMLQPRPGEKVCPFKKDGLCGLHFGGPKPVGCTISPFTLNPNGTLIIRNRYRVLPCFKGKGRKDFAYRVFRSSLDAIFGKANTAVLCAHLDAGGGDVQVPISEPMRRLLLDNDKLKQDQKAREAAGAPKRRKA
jgi:hypothetical protein